MKKHKLLFINPFKHAFKSRRYIIGCSYQPLIFGVLVALTPKENWDIEFIDEVYEEFTYRDADLVAMTSLTSSIPRAYEIAAIYKEKGIPVVLGGVHANMMTDEALQYVDVVARGEAEYIWHQILEDSIKKQLKRIYEGGLTQPQDLATPDHSIFDKYPYPVDCIYFSRGCPMGCEFCSVTALAGAKYRERDIESILTEFASLKRERVFVIDDHLVNNTAKGKERAQKLFSEIIKRKIKKRWAGQASVNIGDDEQLVKLISKAGCRSLLIGFEAETEGKLKTFKKSLNIKRTPSSYQKIIRTLNKYHISVTGAFIFCLENDSIQDLYKRKQFIFDHKIDIPQITILTPLPGTVLFHRIKQSGQLDCYEFPSEWKNFTGTNNLIGSTVASKGEMKNAMQDIYVSVYNKKALRKRMFKTLWATKSFESAYLAYTLDYDTSRMVIPGSVKNGDPILKGRVIDENYQVVDPIPCTYMRFTNFILRFIYLFKWNPIVKKWSKLTFES